MTALTVVGLALILLAGLVHVYIFLLESVLWRRQGARTFGLPAAEVEPVRPWAFNQGFYNLFLAVGAIGGSVVAAVGVLASGSVAAAPLAAALGIAAFVAAVMVGASLVLIATSRAQLRGALVQGVLPLLGLVGLSIGCFTCAAG